MFNKDELNFLLLAVNSYYLQLNMNCIYCDVVDDNAQYAKTRYCVEFCDTCKNKKEVEELILKIKGLVE